MTMQNHLKTSSSDKFSKYFFAFIFLLGLLTLTACGGGGGDTGGITGGDNTGDPAGDPDPVAGGNSSGTPAALDVTASYSDTLTPAGTVYYEFTTIDGTFAYKINLSGLTGSLMWTLYTDASYTSSIDSCYQSSDTSDCDSPTLDPNTTYYLSLTDMTGADNSFNISIETILLSEGTFDTPVQLTVDTPHVGTIGQKLYTSSVKSYYTFTTGAVGTNYTIALSGATTDIKWELYPNTMGEGIEDCDNIWDVGDESCMTKNALLANTSYNLLVITQGPQSTFVTINITEGGNPAAPFSSEGTIATPVALTVDQPHDGSVAPDGTSYYKFTTGNETARYKVVVERTSTNLEATLFTDDVFLNSVDSYYNWVINFFDINWYTITLDPNSTFYLSLREYSGHGDEVKITVYLDALRDADSEGTTITPIPLAFGSTHSGTVGAFTSSLYQLTVNEPKPFNISVSNATTDLSWALVSNWGDTSTVAYCNNIYGTGDETCNAGPVDSGTTLYLSVSNYNETLATTYDLSITYIEGEGEGTQTDPVAITTGSPYLSSASANGSSYYTFTTGAEAMSYSISVTAATSDMKWSVRQDGAFNDLQSCDKFTSTADDEICNTVVLPANTTYRLQVTERDGVRTDHTVSVESIAITNLSIDTPLPGNLVDGYANIAYLKFTTDAVNTDYTVRLTGSTSPLSLGFYPDDTYNTYFKWCDVSPTGSQDISCTATGLALNTTYYLRVYVSKNTGVSDSFDVSVLADDFIEGTATSPIALTTSVDHAGKVQANGNSYYQFTTVSGGPKVQHLISYSGETDVYVRLYDDLFINQIDVCLSYGGLTDCLSSALTAGSTYYLMIDEQDGYSGEFTLNITPQ